MASVQEGSLLVVVLLRLAASSLQQRQHQLLLAAAATVEEVEEVVVPTGNNSVAVVYTIEGAATVLSGKGPQRVIVAGLLQLSAEITYHCVPGTDPAVYVKVRAATVRYCCG
jgi:hypothetical protein